MEQDRSGWAGPRAPWLRRAEPLHEELVEAIELHGLLQERQVLVPG
jgi:hypothetical protein